MGRYARLWILLSCMFALVVAVLGSFDLVVYRAPDLIWIKDKATPWQNAFGSLLAGIILSSLTTWLHAAGERVASALSRSKPAPEADAIAA